MSLASASNKAKSTKGKGFIEGWPFGGLYPSVMISDFFNVVGHLYAAKICLDGRNVVAALGFLSVATAALVGTYRFGFNESYDKMNGDLADIAAHVGLPLVGLEFFKKIQPSPLMKWAENFDCNKMVVAIMFLVTVEGISRSLNKDLQELVKILINVTFYVGPVTYVSYMKQDYASLGAIVAFVVAGVVIKPERNQYLFGMRREDIFHYIIGVAAIFIAKGVVLK